jgi:uncharacterized protein
VPCTKARPGQEPALQELLQREPFYNLFLISNLAEGLSDRLEVWTDEAGGVLMRRAANWVLDTGPEPGRFDFAGAAGIMDGYPAGQAAGLVGRPESVDPLFRLLRRHTGRLYQQMFAGLKQEPAPMAYSGSPRPATPADLDTLAALYGNADEMRRDREAVVRMLPGAWVVEDGGAVVSAACISARTDQAAMIGAVFTPPENRGKGYASSLVHAMCAALLAGRRRPCLFYHNPDAGRIYLRLGFRELGPWRMVRFD